MSIDPKARGLDLVLSYDSFFETNEVLKPGILLEIGFDQISPNAPRDISSWAVDSALLRSLTDVQDNRAKRVSIYNSEYTFVEKLQAIMKKHEQQKAPREWMRHYYDVYMLLGTNEVQQFIGTSDYQLHKEKRFKSLPLDLSNAAAIVLTDSAIFEKYRAAYELESSLYFGNQPKFNLIADRLRNWSAKL